MSESFNLTEHVTQALLHKTLEEATEFAEKHGYKVRVTRIWRHGNWHYPAVTRDHIETRINVGTNDGKITNFFGLG